MRDIESVRLVYKNGYRMEYEYYAQFLNLIGVYVYEDFRNSEDNKKSKYKDTDFSVSYVINKNINFKNNDKVEQLKLFLKEIFEYDIENTWLSELVQIYETGLFQASITLECFSLKSKLALEDGEKFEVAADKLGDLINEKDYWNEKNVRYAKLYCKQKANLGKYLYNESVIYYIDKLALEGLSILKSFTNFSIVWVCLGGIYDISKDFAREAIDSYKRAIKAINDKPYVENVYYKLGKKSENDTTLEKLLENSYKKSYQLKCNCYNCYKVANMYLQRKDFNQSIKYFNECIEKIKERGNYLSPKEQGFYFTSCQKLSSLYLRKKEYTKAIFFANKAIVLKENLMKGKNKPNECTAFYHDLYENCEPQEYIELRIKSFLLKVVYNNMAVACEEVKLDEEAQKYWSLYRSCL